MRLARREGFGPPLRRPVCSCIFQGFMVYSVSYLCRSDGMADVTDSKSVGSDTVWVRVPPSAPRRSKVRFAPTSFFCLRQKKTPSARSLAPPFQLRPALLARSWQAALRAAFFSNRRSRGGPVPSRPGGRPLCSGVFFLPAAKKTPSARSLAPPFQLRPALLARSWQAALRAAFFSNRRSRVSPFLPGWGPSALLRYFLSPAKNAIRTPGRQSSAAVSVYHISFALSRQGRRCAHFHSL